MISGKLVTLWIGFNTHVARPTFNKELRWHESSKAWIDLEHWHLQGPEELWFSA